MEGLTQGDSAEGRGFIASDTYFQIWGAGKVLTGRFCMKTCRQLGLSLCSVSLGWGTGASVWPSCCWGKGHWWQLLVKKTCWAGGVGAAHQGWAALGSLMVPHVQVGSGTPWWALRGWATQQRVEFLWCWGWEVKWLWERDVIELE